VTTLYLFKGFKMGDCCISFKGFKWITTVYLLKALKSEDIP
jgi:hypothetical protein